MKASEALRKGIRKIGGQQTFNKIYRARNKGACALGCIAIGKKLRDKMYSDYFHPCREADRKYKEAYGFYIEEDNDINRRSLKEIAQHLEDIGE